MSAAGRQPGRALRRDRVGREDLAHLGGDGVSFQVAHRQPKHGVDHAVGARPSLLLGIALHGFSSDP